jgi:XTP/dITP diphosphohydrolase
MALKELIFASHNAGKIREIREMIEPLGIELKTYKDIDIPDVEETGTTFAENSLLKSSKIAEITGIACIADDSGLCVDALNGAPGVYSARYAPDRDFDKGMEKLLAEIAKSRNPDRSAHFSCVISLAYPDGKYELFEGRINGKIAEQKQGTGGFGYDPIFIPEGYDKSFAELGNEIKNKISHRGRAMQKLSQYLRNL